jgi:hypothetical protein
LGESNKHCGSWSSVRYSLPKSTQFGVYSTVPVCTDASSSSTNAILRDSGTTVCNRAFYHKERKPCRSCLGGWREDVQSSSNQPLSPLVSPLSDTHYPHRGPIFTGLVLFRPAEMCGTTTTPIPIHPTVCGRGAEDHSHLRAERS